MSTNDPDPCDPNTYNPCQNGHVWYWISGWTIIDGRDIPPTLLCVCGKRQWNQRYDRECTSTTRYGYDGNGWRMVSY